jgi:hypothetical protein
MLGARDIVVKPLSGISPEQARDARARAWAFVFQCWHAKKGEQHDLTKDSTKECTTRPDKKGMQNADLHGD